jgi:hypothetical protein
VTLKLITALQLSATGCNFTAWRLFKISLDEINLIWFFFGIIDRLQICKRKNFQHSTLHSFEQYFLWTAKKETAKIFGQESRFQAKFLNRAVQITANLMTVQPLFPIRNIMNILTRLTSAFFCLFLHAYARFTVQDSVFKTTVLLYKIKLILLQYITVLYCVLLYHTILYYIILYCNIL